MNFTNLLIASLAISASAATFAACSSENDNINGEIPPTPEQPEQPTEIAISGNVSGVWKKNTVVNVNGHITVPKDSTLTIEEGVQVIFSENGVGTSHTPIEFIVDGTLISKGTASSPVLLSVKEASRTAENAFAGLWGGIVATENCPEMLIDNTIIEYTGGDIAQDSPSALLGIYTPGDDADPQITTNNVNGRYVVTNSTLRYGRADGIYMMGGCAIIQHNTFAGNGETGGEAINVKAGAKVDAAFNLIYSPNTNGFKLSSSGQNDEAGRHQALVRAYNNTIVNAGWRRDGVKGGSVYVEKNALVSVFNNLMVNCKFKAMTPKWGTPAVDAGAATECVIDYNFYAAGAVASALVQDVEEGTTDAFLGYTLKNKNVFPEAIDVNSIVAASAGDAATNPLFEAYDINAVALTNFLFSNAYDFHPTASSPVLSGAYAGTEAKMTGYFVTEGLKVNGTTYTSEKSAAYFGAFDKK